MKKKQNEKWSRPQRSGFTLVELMVVIVIIGLLASIVGVNVIGYIAKAKVSAAKAQISIFEEAVSLYKIDTGQYPDNAMGLDALVEQPPGVIGWNKDGYMKGKTQIPLDSWNNPYEYQFPGEFSVYDIFSLGADGKDGGEDEDADIYNSDVVGGDADSGEEF